LREQLVYALEGVDAEDGVDVFEIAPVLIHVGELVRGGSAVLNLGMSIDVRVKPFTEGSWITEFVLNSSVVHGLLSYFKTAEGGSLKELLELLGLVVTVGGGGVVGVVKIVRFTGGKVSEFKDNSDGSFTYINDAGEQLTVTHAEHLLTQSPVIQNNYYNAFILPMDRFPGVTGVSVSAPGSERQKFTEDDRPAFEEYVRTELLDEDDDSVSTMSGVFLKPQRGSYSGEATRYSFRLGESILWPVDITDETFRARLKEGDVRLHYDDALKVDLVLHQKRNVRNETVSTRYTITQVLEYHPFRKHEQLKLSAPDHGAAEDRDE